MWRMKWLVCWRSILDGNIITGETSRARTLDRGPGATRLETAEEKNTVIDIESDFNRLENKQGEPSVVIYKDKHWNITHTN